MDANLENRALRKIAYLIGSNECGQTQLRGVSSSMKEMRQWLQYDQGFEIHEHKNPSLITFHLIETEVNQLALTASSLQSEHILVLFFVYQGIAKKQVNDLLAVTADRKQYELYRLREIATARDQTYVINFFDCLDLTLPNPRIFARPERDPQDAAQRSGGSLLHFEIFTSVEERQQQQLNFTQRFLLYQSSHLVAENGLALLQNWMRAEAPAERYFQLRLQLGDFSIRDVAILPRKATVEQEERRLFELQQQQAFEQQAREVEESQTQVKLETTEFPLSRNGRR